MLSRTMTLRSRVLLLISLTALTFLVLPVQAITENNLWDYPDESGFEVKDYYVEGGALDGTYVGQLHYEWMIEYIENDVSNYDFYAIRIVETLNPSINEGNGPFYIAGAQTTIDLDNSDQMIADALPERTVGTLRYGIGATVTSATASFSATASYAIPDVEIDPNTNANWGGFTEWWCYMSGDAQGDQNRFDFTALIRTTEGSAFDATVTLNSWWGIPSSTVPGTIEFTETLYLYYDADMTPPTNPTGWSGSHSIETWSSDNTIDISWWGASDDDSGVYGYSYAWSTSSSTLPDTTVDTTGTSTTSPALADGNSWYFHIRTVDNVGNWNPGAFHVGPFYIDTTAPSVSITNPQDGEIVSGTVLITASASDGTSGVQKVEFYIDGVLKKTDTTSPYQYSWDTTQETTSLHTIKAVAYDYANNKKSDQITVYIVGVMEINSIQFIDWWGNPKTEFAKLEDLCFRLKWTLNVEAPYMTMLVEVHDSANKFMGMCATSMWPNIPPDDYWCEIYGWTIPEWAHPGEATITVKLSDEPFSKDMKFLTNEAYTFTIV